MAKQSVIQDHIRFDKRGPMREVVFCFQVCFSFFKYLCWKEGRTAKRWRLNNEQARTRSARVKQTKMASTMIRTKSNQRTHTMKQPLLSHRKKVKKEILLSPSTSFLSKCLDVRYVAGSSSTLMLPFCCKCRRDTCIHLSQPPLAMLRPPLPCHHRQTKRQNK